MGVFSLLWIFISKKFGEYSKLGIIFMIFNLIACVLWSIMLIFNLNLIYEFYGGYSWTESIANVYNSRTFDKWSDYIYSKMSRSTLIVIIKGFI